MLDNQKVSDMGMTDHQFDSYMLSLVRDLEDIKEEFQSKYQVKSDKLERLLKDLETQLKWP